MTLSLHVTGDEIVVVDVSSENAPLGTCVAEATWALRLGPAFNRDAVIKLAVAE